MNVPSGKFGGELNLVIWQSILQLPKFPTRIYTYGDPVPKFKSANILAIEILGSTAKFNSRQYFRLYGIKFDMVSEVEVDIIHH